MAFNDLQNVQFTSQPGIRTGLSVQERFLIEALLQDSGVLPSAVRGGTQSPPITPAPPGPTPPSGQASPAPSAPTSNPLVSLALTSVKPGDLITAGFMNKLVQALFELDERLKKIEGAVRAAAPTPPPPQTPTPPPTGPSGLTTGTFTAATAAELRESSADRPTALVDERRTAEPRIESVVATPTRGSGLRITVTGDNLDEEMIEEIRLGDAKFDRSKIEREETGFSFRTSTSVLESAENQLTISTIAGDVDARVAAAKKTTG